MKGIIGNNSYSTYKDNNISHSSSIVGPYTGILPNLNTSKRDNNNNR